MLHTNTHTHTREHRHTYRAEMWSGTLPLSHAKHAALANGTELAASASPVSHQGRRKNILEQFVFPPLPHHSIRPLSLYLLSICPSSCPSSQSPHSPQQIAHHRQTSRLSCSLSPVLQWQFQTNRQGCYKRIDYITLLGEHETASLNHDNRIWQCKSARLES